MPISTGRTRQRVFPVSSILKYRFGTMYKRTTTTGSWVEDSPHHETTPQHNWIMFSRVNDVNHGRGPYRVGGNFQKLMVISALPAYGEVIGGVQVESQNKLRRYVGGFKPPADSFFGTLTRWCTPSSTDAAKAAGHPDLTGKASEAWDRTKPKIQHANLATGLFEAVRETPDLLRQTAKRFHEVFVDTFSSRERKRMNRFMPKKIADDWLAANFGWLPLIGDISDVLSTYSNRDHLIRKLSDENGKSVRRRRLLEEETSEGVISTGTGGPMLALGMQGAGGGDSFYRPGTNATWELAERVTKRTWAVGKFRYFREEFDLSNPRYHSRAMSARRDLTLFGARITPSNLYAVVPWTWLGDWFTNAGHYMDRFSDYAVDGLVAEYFYVMHYEKIERVFRNTFPFTSGDVTVECSRIIESKQRVEASSPYGVDVDFEDLTPKQKSIIAALGLSRRGTFR